MATSHELIVDMKISFFRPASSMVCRAVALSISGLLTHQIQAWVSRTII
jgi:hypothetical protein